MRPGWGGKGCLGAGWSVQSAAESASGSAAELHGGERGELPEAVWRSPAVFRCLAMRFACIMQIPAAARVSECFCDR
jgi:hypothetical protein